MWSRSKAGLDDGWTITLHEPRAYVEADPPRNVKEGWRAGVCSATIWSTDGRRKQLTGVSAVEVLDRAHSWLKWQSNVEPPMRFEPVMNEFVAEPMRQQVAGDTAETRIRRENTERRIVSFASGTAELVDAHGDALSSEVNARASQLATEGESR